MSFRHSLWVKRGKRDYTFQGTIHFQTAIYRVLHEKSNIIASFAEHLNFQQKVTFAEAFWVKRGKTKQQKQNKDTIQFQTAIYVLHCIQHYHCSFHGAPKISRMNYFYRSILGEQWEKEPKEKNQDTINFEIAISRVLCKRSNIPNSFAEKLNLQF